MLMPGGPPGMEDRYEVEPPGLGSGVTRPGQALHSSVCTEYTAYLLLLDYSSRSLIAVLCHVSRC